MEDVGRSGVLVPSVGGFVFDAGSSEECQRRVAEVWIAYYQAVGGAFVGSPWVDCSGDESLGRFADTLRRLGEGSVGGCGEHGGGGSIDGVRCEGGRGVATDDEQGVHAIPGGAVSGVGSGSGVRLTANGRLPRGPNYERNQANRMRKKAAKMARSVGLNVVGVCEEESVKQRQSFFSGCSEGVQNDLRETRAKLLVLENERKILQEEAKIRRLKSPVVYVEEVLRLKKLEEAFGDKNDKISSWAKTVASGSSSSVAHSAPSSVPSVESVSSAVSAAAAKGLKYTMAERYVVQQKLMSEKDLQDARKKVGRALDVNDFTRDDAPFLMSKDQRWDMCRWASGLRHSTI